MPDLYSTGARRRYIEENLKRYRWGEKGGMSLREIAWDVTRAFALPTPKAGQAGVSWATIRSDLKFLTEQIEVAISDEAAELLLPDNFPQWRSTLFTAPNGTAYSTPEHQFALFYVIVALAMKQAPPQWVMDYFELPASVAVDFENMEKMLTFILLLAPRHGKTELVLHALIWLIIYNPNVRIIYCQGILQTSQKVMALIQWELEHNTKLVEWYGPFRKDGVRWNTEDFTVGTRTIPAVSPTFQPIGIQSNIRSLSADIIIVDDPQDVRRVGSATVVQNDLNWFLTELATRREAWTPILGVGSHLPAEFGDLWSSLEDAAEDLSSEGQTIIIRKVPAHRYEACTGAPHIKCVLWPEVRAWWFLESQRTMLERQVPGLFDVVYNQLPRAVNPHLFAPEWFINPYIQPDEWSATLEGMGVLDRERAWKQWPQCCGPIISAAGFDPAAGETKHAAESALVVRAACLKCGRRFVVDYWHARQSPERNPDLIGQYMRGFRPYGLARVRIEINAYQKSLSREPRLREHARTTRFLIEEWRTDDRKNSPELGIPLMAQFPRDGLLSVPAASPVDMAYGDAYIRSYKRYPALPTDIVMADWLAELDLTFQIEEAKHSEPDYLYPQEDIPEYLLEHQYDVDLGELWNVPDEELV